MPTAQNRFQGCTRLNVLFSYRTNFTAAPDMYLHSADFKEPLNLQSLSGVRRFRFYILFSNKMQQGNFENAIYFNRSNVEFWKQQLNTAVLSAMFRPLSRSRAPRSKRHAVGTTPAHKRCLFQNSSFCWSRKELKNFEFFQNSKLSLISKHIGYTSSTTQLSNNFVL